MLTKIGNLSGLQSLKQSQLNLGVIQSLVGEILNSDNCILIENDNGVAVRFSPLRLQIVLKSHNYGGGRAWFSYGTGGLYSSVAGSILYPAAFSRSPLVVPRVSSNFNGVFMASSDQDPFNSPTNVTPVIRFISASNSQALEVKAHFIAIGNY